MANQAVGINSLKLTGIQLTDNELGIGSYASVYEVNYLDLKCAGKRIHESLMKQGGTYARRRFEEECRLLSQLRHPNIVQFLGLYTEKENQAPILVMEFLPANLTSCIENQWKEDQYTQLPAEISYSILHDVALGLNYLHSQRPAIIHRDLSSNNVLLTANMTAKISDLGVAKMLDLSPLKVNRMAHNTKTPGTPAYMPPEAMMDSPTYDTSIDVFSYGVMMIHVFSGKWPVPIEGPIRMNRGRMIPVSEAERREVYLRAIGERHPLLGLIRRCIDNDYQRRPHTSDIIPRLLYMVVRNPPSFSNRLEMLQRMDADEGKRAEFQQQISNLHSDLSVMRRKNIELRQQRVKLQSELQAAISQKQAEEHRMMKDSQQQQQKSRRDASKSGSFSHVYPIASAPKKKAKPENIVFIIRKHRNKPSGLILSKKPYMSEDAVVGFVIVGVVQDSPAYSSLQDDQLRLLDVIKTVDRTPCSYLHVPGVDLQDSFEEAIEDKDFAKLCIDRSIALPPFSSPQLTFAKRNAPKHTHVMVLRYSAESTHDKYGLTLSYDFTVQGVSKDSPADLSRMKYGDKIFMYVITSESEENVQGSSKLVSETTWSAVDSDLASAHAARNSVILFVQKT